MKIKETLSYNLVVSHHTRYVDVELILQQNF